MKKGIIFLLCFVNSGYADSLLTAQSFPKTFEDLSFSSRNEILREGYMPYEIQYDENGVCISGCAYKGVTIQDTMDAIDEANEQMEELISDAIDEANKKKQEDPSSEIIAKNWCENGLSTKLPLRYPVDMTNFQYKISSDFGFRTSSPNGARMHPAVDIACPDDTHVYATADGVVTVGYDSKKGGGGLYIDIKHDNGLITQYLHLKKALVNTGDTVKACQYIANSGHSGTPGSGTHYAAHLDYRIRFNSDKDKYVDILCPCKVTKRTKPYPTSDNTVITSCANSIFMNEYKFKPSAKRVSWRIRHNHCMQTANDLLPDEVR